MKNRLHKPTLTRALAWALAALLAGTPTLFAQRSKDRFAEEIEVVTVEVPIQVLADGEPVTGLTRESFEIYDGRKRQTITGFDVVDLRADRPANLPIQDIPVSARRHFLLLFDLSFSDPSVISRARQAALDLVNKEFHPTDVVAVATYSHQHGPQLILGFTPDRRQLEVAIETLGLPGLVERATDPLAFVIADTSLTEGIGGAESGGGGGNVNIEAMFAENIQDYAVGFDRSERGEAQGRIAALTTAFEDLAKAMGDVTGRKHVVYLSEGFDSQVILGSDDFERRQELAASSASGEYWEVDSEEMYGSTGTLGAVESMLEEFRRADCTIQAVDIGGLRAGPDAQARRSGQDSLFMMANGTGGELYRNFNDLSGAMGAMLERTSVTYVLAFQPSDVKFDGDFHKLRIELKGAPKGAKVVHKPGFYAPKPYKDRSLIEKRLEAAEQILSGEDAGVFGASVVAAPFRAEAGRAYVPVLIEIDGPSLLAGITGKIAALEIYAYAIAEDGSVGDFMTQNMGLDVEKVRPALEASGLKFFGDLELPPGDYLVRVLVRDAESGRSATRAVPVMVPEFGSGSPTLAMPLFPEQPGKWLMVQEAAGTEARSQRPFPFVLDGNSYLPAAKPVIAAGGAAQFIVMGYNLGDEAVPLETTFLTADGAPVEGPKISFVARGPGASPDATQLVLQLEPNGLPAGEYRLVTSLQGQERTTSIPFVVSGG
jgi:VWFA-related protein